MNFEEEYMKLALPCWWRKTMAAGITVQIAAILLGDVAPLQGPDDYERYITDLRRMHWAPCDPTTCEVRPKTECAFRTRP